MGRVRTAASKAVENKKRYTVSKLVLQAVLLPMAVFGTQQLLAGDAYVAAGAFVVAAAALAFDYMVGLEGIPWDERDLQDAAERVGAGIESAVDQVNERAGR